MWRSRQLFFCWSIFWRKKNVLLVNRQWEGRNDAITVDICKKLNHFTLKTQFEASEGVTGILGASGCGKSMTLRCIAGIEKPDEGYIELNGKVFYDSKNKINLRPQERHVGLLFQNYALFPNMTVEQNLMAGLLSGERIEQKPEQKSGKCLPDLN